MIETRFLHVANGTATTQLSEAAGIPVVSTRLGAEGLTDQDGGICALADDPVEFAGHVVRLLRLPEEAQSLESESCRHKR